MHREKTRQESGYNDAYEGHGYCENRECGLIRQIMSTPTSTSEGLRIRAEILWGEVEYLVKDYEKEEGTYEAECVQHLRGFMEDIAKRAA